MTSASQQILDDLIALIDGTLAAFGAATTEAERELLDGLTALLDDFEYTSGSGVRQTAANIRRIADIRAEATRILTSGAFAVAVAQYTSAFAQVQQLANAYFQQAVTDFAAQPVLEALRQEAVQQAVGTLAGAGINAGVSAQIEKLLMDNVATGASKAQLAGALRQNLLSSGGTNGLLARYAETYTDTSLHTYARQYMDLVAGDLGLDWYLYEGSKKETSRPFCIRFAGKYWHKREVQNMGRGLQPSGLTPLSADELQGRIKGTNASSIFSNAGGWRCRHLFIPVAIEAVPDSAIKRAKAEGFL